MGYLFGDDPDFTSRPQPGEQTHPRATAADLFAAQWSRNEIYSQDYFGEHDRFGALQDYIDNTKQRTGVDLGKDLDWGDTSGVGVMPAAQQMRDQVNGKLADLKKQNPTIDVQPMSYDDLEQNAVAKRKKADADFQDIMGRERAPGATIGSIAGGLVTGAVGDPISAALLPAAPEESLGIVANALRWGAIAGGGQVASTLLQAPYREEVQPGYLQSGQPFLDVAQAAGEAALGGFAFRGAADVWSRVMKGAWPESVRQAGNVVSSQANVIASNAYPGPDGAAAHPQALFKANSDIAAGRPVDVTQHITPELDASAATAPIEATRTQAQAAAAAAAQARAAVPTEARQLQFPFAQTEAERQAEAARQLVANDVQILARRAAAPYDMPAEEAARIADRLTKASPQEAQDLIRDLHMSPRQVADAPTRIAAPAEPISEAVAPVTQATPELADAMRADLDRELVARPAPGAPAVGSKEELQSLITQKAPAETLINHPFVQETLARAREIEPTSTAEDLANPKWRANRVYDFDGMPVQGFDNAVDRLTGRFEAAAGPEGVANERHVVLVTGPPASGKSSFAVPLARELRAAIPDPDEAKLVIPEYQGGVGSLAVHNESSKLTRETTTKLVSRGANMVIPTVGANLEHLQNVLRILKDGNYTVDVMHVSAGAEVSSRRNIQRIINTGRVVEPEYLLDAAEKTGPTAYMMKERGLVRDFADIDTSGESPIVRTGEGPLAEMVRSGRYLAERPGGGPERRFGEAEGLRTPAGGTPPGATPAEEVIPNLPEPMTVAQALREVDAYKAVAEQIGACAAPVAEAA